MGSISFSIDGRGIETRAGASILEAAREAGIYIPSLCSHPDLPPFEGVQGVAQVYRGKETRLEGATQTTAEVGCRLCLVEVEGLAEATKACTTPVSQGMVVRTNTPTVLALRQENLARILATHPHVCLMCAQREGCSRSQCSMNVPVPERCCDKFGACEIQKVADYIGIRSDTPRYVHRELPVVTEEPLFRRDYNLCINCGRCVRACHDLRGIGALGVTFLPVQQAGQDGEALVGHLEPTLAESGCKFCGACVEVCPTGTLLDKAKGTDRDSLVPCQAACPVGMDVPNYVRLIAQGDHAGAAAVIRSAAPLASILGRVCFHPCETACRRGQVNEPISICRLKRFATDQIAPSQVSKAPATGKRVAIVGSGPAGLSAAYYLQRLGHQVTIFEALPEAGGMLRVGIPEYRLPRELLQKGIKEIEDLGVEIKTNAKVDSLETLLQDGHDAVFVAIGAHKGHKMGIQGEEAGRVMDCITFLRELNLGSSLPVGKKVVVIGGGSSAVDAARAALRLGAKEVYVVYRRSREEMPALASEVEEAVQEGVQFRYLAAPVCFITDGDQPKVQCVEMELGELDSTGRPRPTPVEGSEFLMDADLVITAIGQAPDLPPGFSLKASNAGLLQADPDTLATSQPGVFAGGDAVSGPASVVEAIAMGKRAAASIHRYLGGKGFVDDQVQLEKPNPHLGRDEDFASWARTPMPTLGGKERLASFAEVELGYDEKLAVKEAKRCFQCDLRFFISPVMLPPEKWLEFKEENLETVPEVEGVFQLLDENKEILQISGVSDLRQGLRAQLSNPKARYFLFEEDPMYTKRESELIQEYLREHGRLPEGNEVSDDLFD
jgi:NADPH-dependent glutamate synthase beta subunit-like oxidoreductase